MTVFNLARRCKGKPLRLLIILTVMGLTGCSAVRPIPVQTDEAPTANQTPSTAAYYYYVKGLSADALRQEARRPDLSLEQKLMLQSLPEAPSLSLPPLTKLLDQWQPTNEGSDGIILLLVDMQRQLLQQQADNMVLWQRNAELEQLLRQLRDIETHIQNRELMTDEQQ